jgi:hypothetical protein
VAARGVVAAPAWAPDSSGLLYFQPQQPTGHFQLYHLQLPPAPSPGRAAQAANANPMPRQVTEVNDFDATSTPVWF